MFRLAKLQERQGLFDAAESTLLAARQQKPDDVAPYRELAQYFARRVAAMTAARSTREARETGPDTPDKDGVYSLGGSVQTPEKISAENVAPAGGGDRGRPDRLGDDHGRGGCDGPRDRREDPAVGPGLDAAALAAVRQWRFAPATLNGQPVPVRMPVVVKF